MDAIALPHSSINKKGMKARYLRSPRRFLHLLPVSKKHCEMAVSDVARQLKSFVSFLKNQGTLDEGFDVLVKLKDDQFPQFLLETIALFFKETDITIHEIQRAVYKYPVEYSNVVGSAHKLKGSCASIGGRKMASACKELRQASEDENIERSIDALSKIKCEYEVLRDGLGLISRMERRIIALKNGGQA